MNALSPFLDEYQWVIALVFGGAFSAFAFLLLWLSARKA